MSDIAIRCDSVWKSYRVYHQRSHTLKERLLTRRNAYEEFWALREVGFEVPAGSTLGIVGSNGSGKSTMLKVLARILTPNRGSVSINGTMSSLLELGTGFHPDLTGTENVFLASSLMGSGAQETRRRYDEIVDFAGIADFMDLPVKNYSSGMYARLAFAVAISVDPEILLIDEVLSVGDEQFQMRCFEKIAQFKAEGRTIVLVSHSLDAIRSLCQDAIWLEKGTLRSVGRSHDVVADYLDEVHHTEAHQPQDVRDSGDRWGSREVEITDVTVLDAGGAPVSAVRTGEAMTIRVRYRSNEPVDDLTCGIALWHAETLTHVYGSNSGKAGTVIDVEPEGVVEFAVAALPFLKGNYQLTVALHDSLESRVFDWHERRYSLLVFDDPRAAAESGLVHVEGAWRSAALDTAR